MCAKQQQETPAAESRVIYGALNYRIGPRRFLDDNERKKETNEQTNNSSV